MVSLVICGGVSPWYEPNWPREPRCRWNGHDRRMAYLARQDIFRCPRCQWTMPFDTHWLLYTTPEYRSNHCTELNGGRRYLSYSPELVSWWRNVDCQLPPGLWHDDAYAYRYAETWNEASELVG